MIRPPCRAWCQALIGTEVPKVPKAISIRIRTLISDDRAQDMVEYALLAGFIAVAAGATLPPVASAISTIFSKMNSLTTEAAKL